MHIYIYRYIYTYSICNDIYFYTICLCSIDVSRKPDPAQVPANLELSVLGCHAFILVLILIASTPRQTARNHAFVLRG